VPFSPLLTAWEADLTVVQWDQRGAGRTYLRNGPDPDLAVDRVAADGVELATWLRSELGVPSVVLLGSSAGSVIAGRMARRAPEHFSCVVGANQLAPGSRAASWARTREALRAAGSRRPLRRLEALGADVSRWTAAEAEEVSKLAVDATPAVPHLVHDLMLPALMWSPGMSLRDIGPVHRSMTIARDALYPELREPDVAGEYEMPYLLVLGAEDLVTPVSAARELAERIVSPRTEVVLVPGAGHLVEFARPEAFLEVLRTCVPSSGAARDGG
jgi:pimeloyl-ACP methyl ester carboxylesterase